MLRMVQVASLLLVAAAWAFTLAHAAEMPGKRRLDQATYLAVQRIYYPGYTVGGASEPLAIIALVALAIAIGPNDPAFPGIAVALVAMIAGQVVFWFMTQPINRVWLKDEKLGSASAAFFGVRGAGQAADWTSNRDRWEYSHLLRGGLFTIAMVALALALTG
jgi:hypothetical protein